MITNKTLSKKLTQLLNLEVPTGAPFEFYIHDNEGEYLSKINVSQQSTGINLVNGIAIEQSSSVVPLVGLDSYLLNQSLQIVIPVNLLEYDEEFRTGGIEYINKLITEFCQHNTGSTGTISNEGDLEEFAYVLSLSMPGVSEEEYKAQIGKAINVYVNLQWQLIKDGVLGNNIEVIICDIPDEYIETSTMPTPAAGIVGNKYRYTGETTAEFKKGLIYEVQAYQSGSDTAYKYTLKGSRALLMDGSAVRTRTGDTSAYMGSEELETTIEQQGLTIKLIMPYKKTGVSAGLAADLFNGNIMKKYALYYNDGYIEWNKACCAREITLPMTAGKIASISATFEIAR